MVFSLAHLSDLHLPPPKEAMALPDRNLKRSLAKLSWLKKRRHIHTLRPLSALRLDLAAHSPDHLALTGDLTNFGQVAEFSAAKGCLEQWGTPAHLSVIPGNHDVTASVPWQAGLGQWRDWMCGDAGLAGIEAEPFPFLRRRGPLAIIGVNSAIPTRIFCAAGAVGAPQLGRLAALLQETAAEGLFRVLLIHHPPTLERGGERKALRDRAALRAVLERHGAELILSGHHHVTRLAGIRGPLGPIPSFGVPAALASREHPEPAGWHLHRVTPMEDGWRLSSLLRRYDLEEDRFATAGRWHFALRRVRNAA